jgi:hypothetical protein
MSGTQGKVVIITGASSGIDEATALLLAGRGAKVVLGARGPDRLSALAARIVAAGGEAASAPTNVKRRDDLAALVNLASERYGKLDVLVNNVGVMPISPLDDLRVEDWEEMIDVNIKGVLYGIQRDVSADGQEVLAISNSPDVVRRIREQREPIHLRCRQVRREHVRPLGGHHEYVSRLQPERRTLAVNGEPARALHNRGELDLLGWREFERPVPPAFSVPILTHRALASVKTSARGSPSIR